VVITADEGLRGGKKVPLKSNVDAAIAKSGGVDWVVVVKRTGAAVDMKPSRDFWYHDAAKMVTDGMPVRTYARGGSAVSSSIPRARPANPRGVLHTTAGYLVFASMTHQYVFDYHDGDIYWCTADVGWVTGHSYILYWAAGERRDHADVRRRAELSRLIRGSGMSSTSTRSTSSTPRRPRSAR